MPWLRPNASAPASATTLLPLDPKTYYGAASDYSAGSASLGTLGHTPRFDGQADPTTKLRAGHFNRDHGAAGDYRARSAGLATLGHPHRFDGQAELKTQLRVGHFERDQRAGAIRFAQASRQPGGLAATLENFGPATRLERRTHLKIQELNSVQLQSDFSNKFQALGRQHELLAGADFTDEKKTVSAARSAA